MSDLHVMPGTPRSIASALKRWWIDTTDPVLRNTLIELGQRSAARSTPQLERKRGFMAVDWFMRDYAPSWYELGGYKDLADQLRSLSPITCGPEMACVSDAHKRHFDVIHSTWQVAKPHIVTKARTFTKTRANIAIDHAALQVRYMAVEGGWHAMRTAAYITIPNILMPWDIARTSLICAMRAKTWMAGLNAATNTITDDVAGQEARYAAKIMVSDVVARGKQTAIAIINSMITVK